MRRLPGIALITGATLTVIVALFVSGLRLALPQLDRFRPQVVAWVQSATGVPLEAGALRGSWESFGPTLEITHLSAVLPESRWQAERITLALDVWQSLLHGRWQFRDLTFHRMRLTLNATLTGRRADGSFIESDRLSSLFLRQFDHFDLRDSHISFLTPSGERAELAIPQLTWLNRDNRHRAEGQISLSSFNGQHGVVQMRMDVRDDRGRLDDGTVYLQADNIDMRPWLSRWLKNNTGLESADFNLAAWLQVRGGQLYGGDLYLNAGAASWREGEKTHVLKVDDLTLHAVRQGNGWQVVAPALNLTTDGVAWPRGALAASWSPPQEERSGAGQQEELRIRASRLNLERLRDLLPLLATTTPELKARWESLRPTGDITRLALDVPLRQPELSRFQIDWQEASWQPWQSIPGADRVAGSLSGSLARGRLTFGLQHSTLPYGAMFSAPLEIGQASGAVDWRNSREGWELWGRGLDVQARSLWVNGDFHYRHPAQGEPRLDVLAGIRLTDAADAWRYYPGPLMGAGLVKYLSGALKGGRVDNGTLMFAGNPQRFPFKRNEGQFEVWVPLREATFEFQPGWPALSPLAIDLDFANDGLWMLAPQAWLGKVEGSNIRAVIADYRKEQLLIDGELSGDGAEIGRYFEQTPLKPSLGRALQALQIGGNVDGTLHLDIPLSHGEVRASGDVQLGGNRLYIKPLDAVFDGMRGRFHYQNGNLTGDRLRADWLGQPVTLDFTTEEQETAFLVNVGLEGQWAPARFPALPATLEKALSGSAAWRSDVSVLLPHKGASSYEVDVQADLTNVSARLPSPLHKPAGDALPLSVKVKGDLQGFSLMGSLGKTQRFNSQWRLKGDAVTLARANWQHDARATPALPEASELVLGLPALDGEHWLALLPSARGALAAHKDASARFHVPDALTLNTPEIQLLGQRWHDVSLTSRKTLGGNEIRTKGREIDATLTIPGSGRWRGDIRYLYYNPQWKGDEATNPVALAQKTSPLNEPSIRFEDWPALRLDCRQCWIMGQNLGRVQATLQPETDKLTLSDGVIDTGIARLTASGSWQENAEGVRTAFKGRLSGGTLEQNADWFGMETPLRAASFDLDYDLYWSGTPWAPQIASLSGILHSRIGKGEVVDVGTGQAGRLLRLVSFDALLRKLQFDFSDTFGKGFYFDAIRSTAWIKDGVLHSDDLLIDGLEADIAMQGSVNLVDRQVNLEAVVAPEISATVGVATAFVVNPVVGAAVFAASKVLAPLWNKISLIRYQIEGSVDQPTIKEVLREQQKR